MHATYLLIIPRAAYARVSGLRVKSSCVLIERIVDVSLLWRICAVESVSIIRVQWQPLG
jgi:hypothetical protein